MTKRHSQHKLTRQGVRDLGHGPKKRAAELPPKQQALECAHVEIGIDRFRNRRCRDCGLILDEPGDWL